MHTTWHETNSGFSSLSSPAVSLLTWQSSNSKHQADITRGCLCSQAADAPDINIICEKVAFDGVTRFEDRYRLPLGVTVNLTDYSAQLATEVSHATFLIPPAALAVLRHSQPDISPRNSLFCEPVLLCNDCVAGKLQNKLYATCCVSA